MAKRHHTPNRRINNEEDDNDEQENSKLPVYGNGRHRSGRLNSTSMLSEGPRVFAYNNRLPFIFIVGLGGSGMKLMGQLLNQNPYIRCSPEIFLVSNLIMRRNEWTNSNIEKERLQHGGMTDYIMDSAVMAFIMELLLKQDKIANRLCNVDAHVFNQAMYVNKILPDAKFVWMIRDARATATSIINRGIEMRGLKSRDYKDVLSHWNKMMDTFGANCNKLGPRLCKPVFYEDLLLNTNKTLKSVLRFLNVPNSDNTIMVTNSQSYPKDSIKTRSNVTTPVQVDKSKVDAWVKQFPSYLMPLVPDLAPIMTRFGYDTSGGMPSSRSYSNLKYFSY